MICPLRRRVRYAEVAIVVGRPTAGEMSGPLLSKMKTRFVCNKIAVATVKYARKYNSELLGRSTRVAMLFEDVGNLDGAMLGEGVGLIASAAATHGL
jgi:hypothetical protein